MVESNIHSPYYFTLGRRDPGRFILKLAKLEANNFWKIKESMEKWVLSPSISAL